MCFEWPFSNECSCFDGKQRLLLDLSKKHRAISQKGFLLQSPNLLTAIVSLWVISLLVIDLRRSHLFGFFLWNLECIIYRKILVACATTCPILLLFATSISPSSVFTFVVLLFLFLITVIANRLMPALYIPLRPHLALPMLLTWSFVGLLVMLLLCVLRLFSFSDGIRLLLWRIRLDRL